MELNKQEILTVLSNTTQVVTAEAMGQQEPLRSQMLLEALRCSVAGWILNEADDLQVKEIWMNYGKPANRN